MLFMIIKRNFVKKELRCFLIIVTVFISSVFFLFGLLKKYSFFTLEHFLEVCRQVSSGFLASGLQHIGFGLLVLTFFSIAIFFVKAIFSYIKTQKKLASLLNSKSNVIPGKLLNVIEKNKVEKNLIFVVNLKKDIALTIDWSGPKIILSTGLIDKLEPEELESVVLHEYYHAKYRHPLMLIISEIVSDTLFFIPVYKDLHKYFRSLLEKEADDFVSSLQNGATSLDLALSKVETETRFPIFPSFSKRIDHKISRRNAVLSVLTVTVGLALYLLPTQTYASWGNSHNFSEVCIR